MKHYIIFLAILASNLLACANNPKSTTTTETTVEVVQAVESSLEATSLENNIENDSSPIEVNETEETHQISEDNQTSAEPDQRAVAAKEVVIPVGEDQPPVKIIEKSEDNTKMEDNPLIEEIREALVSDTAVLTEIKNEETELEIEDIPDTEPPFSHSKWDELLRKYVSSNGKVNYKGFKSEQAKLNAYLKELSDNPPAASWSKNKRLAYWINVYNAYTVDLIVRNYPLRSIRNLNEPWKTPFFKIGGRTLSLNDVEHEIIRKEFNEARIHFAVNCASFSCPALLNRAYTEASLNSQLDRQTRSYINNPAHNTISGGKAEISQLFNWYGDDFKKDAGTVKAFINKYATTKVGDKTELKFKEYNWNLNE